MAYPVGPKFSLRVAAPADWNRPGLVGDTQVAVETASGEGLVLEVPAASLREKLRAGSETLVFVAHVIREDQEIYFTFESPSERALFLLLTDLDAIGPKTAGQILAALGRDGLRQIGRTTGALPKIPGVGPKTLEKLRSGLKLSEEKFLPLLADELGTAFSGKSRGASSSLAGMALPPGITEALERLGLRPQDTLRLYEELSREEAVDALPVGDLLRKMIQRWGRQSARPAAGREA